MGLSTMERTMGSKKLEYAEYSSISTGQVINLLGLTLCLCEFVIVPNCKLSQHNVSMLASVSASPMLGCEPTDNYS